MYYITSIYILCMHIYRIPPVLCMCTSSHARAPTRPLELHAEHGWRLPLRRLWWARHSRAGKLGRALGAGASGLTSLSNTLKALTMSFVGVVSVKPAMTALKSAKATSFFAPIGSSADFL